MRYYEVAPNLSFRQNSDFLTYHHDAELLPGVTVSIQVGSKSANGVIFRQVTKPDFATKPISRVLYDTPLPPHLLSAISWLSDYYSCPLTEVVRSALPTGLDKTRRSPKPRGIANLASEDTVLPTGQAPASDPATAGVTQRYHQKPESAIPLNSAQRQVLSAIQSDTHNFRLLHGITGSGKTNIYLNLVEQIFYTSKSAILLLPEIALTPQLVTAFEKFFPTQVILLHSQQTESERHQLWQQILRTDTPQIIIGPRSALFAPIKNLGLIIIDEAHEPAYFQDQNPKYSAIKLADHITSQIPSAYVLLGSATPRIADLARAKSSNSLFTLDQLAVQSQHTNTTNVISLSQRSSFTKHRFLSDLLLSSIQASLDSGTQSLIFHNRRGSAPVTVCDQCGWQALCPSCYLPLTLHADDYQLVCHTCGYHTDPYSSCPKCHNASIQHRGIGTKLIESELRRLFPHANIARFDADSDRERTIDKLYAEVQDGSIDIIIGTQILAKGFDLPKLSTLAIIQADSLYSLPDFSSEERGYQLLTQAIGRASRGHRNTTTIIQVYNPLHPVITAATASDQQIDNYHHFYQHLLPLRRRAKLPPFYELLKLTLTYKTETVTIKNIRTLQRQLSANFPEIAISAPTPAFHERATRGYTWQIIARSKKHSDLTAIVQSLAPNPNLRFSIDPPSLL
jgi:primosomal protein N' (replication factor Y)